MFPTAGHCKKGHKERSHGAKRISHLKNVKKAGGSRAAERRKRGMFRWD